MWPHCLQRLEGVSPEVERLWLSHVQEARPVYRHGWRIATLIVALPVTGAIGWALLTWCSRRDRELLRRILGAALPGLAATLLLLWQTRTGPAAQMLAVVGAAALVWFLVPLVWTREISVGARAGRRRCWSLIGLGAAVPFVVDFIPEQEADAARDARSARPTGCAHRCGAMQPVALQPKGMVFTFVDLGPRLITVTHHDAITGPYHRNGAADRRRDERLPRQRRPGASRSIAKYHSNYVLTCPNSSTTTIFMSEAPKGFYAQLAARPGAELAAAGRRCRKDSPFKMWKVVG